MGARRRKAAHAIVALGIAVTATILLNHATACAQERPEEWTEDAFEHKPDLGRRLVARPGSDPRTARTVIGKSMFYEVQGKDTFLDIARYYGLGHNDVFDANPGVDEWIPPAGQYLLLPTEYVLPDTPLVGIKVNIPEMRLYYFQPQKDGDVIVTTYPVGLGRDEWRTPQGAFKVRGKTVNPRWVLPESIKREHRQMGKPAPEFIEGGSPDNPLGLYRIELTLNMYAIHGTNIPWGVGMQVSHGCVRLYPEDIERLFPNVPIGTTGEFFYQPVKLGSRDGRVFLEVHKDIYTLKPGLYQEAMRLVEKNGWRNYVDAARVQRAVEEQSGVPIDVTRDSGGNTLPDEVISDVQPRPAAARRDGQPVARSN